LGSASTHAQTQRLTLSRVKTVLTGAQLHFLPMRLAQCRLLFLRPRRAHPSAVGLAFFVGHLVGTVNQLALLRCAL